MNNISNINKYNFNNRIIPKSISLPILTQDESISTSNNEPSYVVNKQNIINIGNN